MSIYSASFVRASRDPEASFAETCRLLREHDTEWLAASPKHLAAPHTVRIHPGTPWISIENAAADELLRQISQAFAAEASTFYCSDEHALVFGYSHFEDGALVRGLHYAGASSARDDERWLRVIGQAEAWESILFAPEMMSLYDRHRPQDAAELRKTMTITEGSSIPWACDGTTIAAIAKTLGLPWDPWNGRFFPADRVEVIRGRSSSA